MLHHTKFQIFMASPKEFHIDWLAIKKQYILLGNNLNVVVVYELKYLFRTDLQLSQKARNPADDIRYHETCLGQYSHIALS